jgi:putative FmdB family regulatory protein
MPIYEYVCGACSHRFDLLVRGPRARVRCPKCKGRKAKKAFSVFGMSTGGRDMPRGSGGCHGCSPGGCGGGRCS